MYEYLLSSFIVVEILSMLFNFNFTNLEFQGYAIPINFSVVFFCLGFFIIDVIHDFYDRKKADKFIFIKIFSQVLFFVLGNIAVHVYDLQSTQISEMLSMSPYVVINGSFATIAGFGLTNKLMSVFKSNIYLCNSVTKRYFFSTLPGEILFSVVFSALSFSSSKGIDDVLFIILSSSVIKLILSLLFAVTMSLIYKAHYYKNIE